MSAPDTMTVLRARGRRLAKLIRADGEVVGYDSARTFDMAEVPAGDLDAIEAVLRRLLPRPDCAIVRGAVADPARSRGVRRLLHPDPETGEVATLRDVPRASLALDVEGVERPEHVRPADLRACAAEAIGTLPSGFQGAACIVQASASHGIKPGVRLRLWYRLSRPTSGAELKRWLRDTPADPSVFGAAQLIYTAAPVFADGTADPLPERLVWLPGRALVPVPSPALLTPPPRAVAPEQPVLVAGSIRAGRYGRAALVGAAARIMRADKRHPVILAECRGLARLVQAGLVAEADVRAVVGEAARRIGKQDAAEIDACLAWALAHPSTAAIPEVRHG